MIEVDRYLLIRSAALYLAVAPTIVVWLWRRPTRRLVTGAVLASAWNLPVVLALHFAAGRIGWWHFDARGGLFFGMPVEIYLAWAWLWGALPAIAFPSAPLAIVAAFALAADLALMPSAAPVLLLGPDWLAGECIGLAVGLLPAQLLARWTARDERLAARTFLQTLAFSGLTMMVVPAVIVDGSGSAWSNPLSRPLWQISLIVQLLAIPALMGITAVQEFVVRGGGTPVPFDPPRRLVTSGVYSYVRNPMQLSAVLLLAVWGLLLRSAWISAAGLMAHVYAIGLAGWDEEEDLRQRFRDDWVRYRSGVRRWVPRLRPWRSPSEPAARLYVSQRCAMCSEVAQWFHQRHSVGLTIVPAEEHPSGELARITYESADGTFTVNGVNAVARALEHLHLGWALAGFILGLPGLCSLVQLLADASGAEPRILREAKP